MSSLFCFSVISVLRGSGVRNLALCGIFVEMLGNGNGKEGMWHVVTELVNNDRDVYFLILKLLGPNHEVIDEK